MGRSITKFRLPTITFSFLPSSRDTGGCAARARMHAMRARACNDAVGRSPCCACGSWHGRSGRRVMCASFEPARANSKKLAQRAGCGMHVACMRAAGPQRAVARPGAAPGRPERLRRAWGLMQRGGRRRVRIALSRPQRPGPPKLSGLLLWPMWRGRRGACDASCAPPCTCGQLNSANPPPHGFTPCEAVCVRSTS